MTGESQREPKAEPDPTVITTEIITKEITHLRELIQSKLDDRDLRYTERFDAQQRAVEEAFRASEKAILKAEVSIEKRADATYVSLQEMGRALGGLMPRNEVEARLGALSDQVAALTIRQTEVEQRKVGGDQQRTAVFAFAGFVAAVVLIGGVLLAAWPR